MTPIQTLAVVGAGNMGSGIAQKMATEGFDVVLVDVDAERVGRGLTTIDRMLAEAVDRRVMRADRAAAIRSRIQGTTRLDDVADAGLVVEAVFEDLALKQDVFRRLDAVCGPETILATNTSSYLVSEIASVVQHPSRVLGLHYFFHPAKNHLVEVIPAAATDPAVLRRAWSLQERLRKIPIASRDAYGFIVNRFFVVWLVEAVRMLEEGVADAATIDAIAKETFGIGMGPFELMNVTGVPIAFHASTTIGQAYGPMYAPPARLRTQAGIGQPWSLDGPRDGKPRVPERPDGDRRHRRPRRSRARRRTPPRDHVSGGRDARRRGDRHERRHRPRRARRPSLAGRPVRADEPLRHGAIARRRCRRSPPGGICRCRRRSRRPAGPTGRSRCRWCGRPVRLQPHTTYDSGGARPRGGITTITIDRPDAMNALNETVVSQLREAFRRAAADPATSGIVIAGAGRSFVAGADIRFFIQNIESGDLDRIVRFTEQCQALLLEIQNCPKPVVARVHGLALGGGVELALACDYIVAAPGASLGFPETGIGIYPGLGGTQRTTRRIGRGLAKWLVLTGSIIPAEEAAAIGLIDRVAPYEDLDAAAAALIESGVGGERRPGPVPASHLRAGDVLRLERRRADSNRSGGDPRRRSAGRGDESGRHESADRGAHRRRAHRRGGRWSRSTKGCEWSSRI